MPELPEVQTTVNGLNRNVRGRTIVSVSTTYNSPYYRGKDEIKNPNFFQKFRQSIVGAKIINAERRAKNILIHLSTGDTVLVHMKMTGHFVYDRPEYPFIRLVLLLDNNKALALSDMRKFGKVTLFKTSDLHTSPHLSGIGPEPLEDNFKLKDFKIQISKRSNGKIKTVLMDPSVVAGIGNIYSDEILWRAGVHPLSRVSSIPEKNLKLMFTAMKLVLHKGIELGGDSMSDYRNIDGERGEFQEHHKAYQNKGKKCEKRGCKGVIERLRVGGRSAHFCPKHQKLFK